MQTVTIAVTNSCPNRCPACFVWKTDERMSLEDFKKVIKKLPSNLITLVFTGGETFTHPDLLKMCKYAAEFLIKPLLFTSGAVFLDMKPFKRYIDSVTVTIKYPSEELDNEWKGNPKAYKNAIRLLGQLKKLGIPRKINWAVDRDNVVVIEEMVKLAEKYDATIDMLRFMPYTHGVRTLALTDEEWEMVCEESLKYELIKIRSPSRYSYQSCTGGVGRLSINVDGSVTPCLYWTFDSVANLLNESYEEVEKSLEEWRYRIANAEMCPVMHYLKSQEGGIM